MRRALAVLMFVPFVALAQQRDTPAPTTAPATGEISGVIISAEAPAQPLRRAVVTITGDLPAARSVITDDTGAFVFRSLPVGSFTVTARKAAYIAAPYGARRPGRTGTPISLAAGQHAAISIAMFKGAAIAGVLRDAAGQPLAGVGVRAIDVRIVSLPPAGGTVDMATTDDRGAFRLYGLMPGEYLVAALPSVPGPEIGAPTVTEVDRLLSSFANRGRAGVAPSSAAPSSDSRPRSSGYAPVFFPGTPLLQDAGHVMVAPGEERAGVDFEVRALPFASVEGTVTGVANLSAVQVTIIPSNSRIVTSYNSSNLSGKPIDADGRFRYANLAPGHYRVIARALRDAAPPAAPATQTAGGGRSGVGAPTFGVNLATPTGDALFAYADIDLRGEDVSGLSLALQPGATISGRVVFTGASAMPADLTKVRVSLNLEDGGWSVSSDGLTMGPSFAGGASATLKADGTFEVRGIAPGRFTVTCTLPSDVKGWSLRSVRVGDRDLLDDLLDPTSGMDLKGAIVSFSDTPSELSGVLQSASGQPATPYSIVALPADRSLWRARSRRIVSARPSTSGRFVFPNLPAGAYLLTALTDLDPLDLVDMTFLEQLAASGLAVTVQEGEKKIQDLRIK